MMAPPCHGQRIKCPYPRAGSGVRARYALERGGARSRAARTLERGGARSRKAFSLERGGARPGEECPLRWAVRATVAWAMPCVLKRDVFGFGLFAGFKWGFPSCLRGPLGLSRPPSPTEVSTPSAACREEPALVSVTGGEVVAPSASPRVGVAVWASSTSASPTTCGSGDLVREGDDGVTGTPYGLAAGLHGKIYHVKIEFK
jgi:hypothetical protein